MHMILQEAYLNRTTIVLPQDLKARAIRLAKQLGISLGELVRQSLASQLKPVGRQASLDPLLADHAVYSASTPKDLAKNHDAYLYGESE